MCQIFAANSITEVQWLTNTSTFLSAKKIMVHINYKVIFCYIKCICLSVSECWFSMHRRWCTLWWSLSGSNPFELSFAPSHLFCPGRFWTLLLNSLSHFQLCFQKKKVQKEHVFNFLLHCWKKEDLAVFATVHLPFIKCSIFICIELSNCPAQIWIIWSFLEQCWCTLVCTSMCLIPVIS